MGSQRFSLQPIQWHDLCHIQIRVPADSSPIPMAWPQVSNCGADEMEWEEEQEEANAFCAIAIGIPVIQWKGHSFKVTWWWTYGWWWTTMDGMGGILFSDKTIWMGGANYACSWGSSGTSERETPVITRTVGRFWKANPFIEKLDVLVCWVEHPTWYWLHPHYHP